MLPRRAPQRRRDLALALIVARLLEPAAKLATARMLDPAHRQPFAAGWHWVWGKTLRRASMPRSIGWAASSPSLKPS